MEKLSKNDRVAEIMNLTYNVQVAKDLYIEGKISVEEMVSITRRIAEELRASCVCAERGY